MTNITPFPRKVTQHADIKADSTVGRILEALGEKGDRPAGQMLADLGAAVAVILAAYPAENRLRFLLEWQRQVIKTADRISQKRAEERFK